MSRQGEVTCENMASMDRGDNYQRTEYTSNLPVLHFFIKIQIRTVLFFFHYWLSRGFPILILIL